MFVRARQWAAEAVAILGMAMLAVLAFDGRGGRGVYAAAERALDTAQIERLTGMKGQFSAAEHVFKVSAPRTDLQVTVAGVTVTPPMGLTSYAAFMPAREQVMVMGDTVLLPEQVNPVMDVALAAGLEVTALHNHFFWDTPKVMFMHLGGTGDLATLARAVGKVFATIKETSAPMAPRQAVGLGPNMTSLDPKPLDAILGVTGDLANGVYKATIGRTTQMHGHAVGNTMGVNTWAAFVGSDAQAAVDGDFVMREDELHGVLRALRQGGIDIVAIHNHVEGESPRIVFLHYWGIGPTADLARTLRAALDTQKRG